MKSKTARLIDKIVVFLAMFLLLMLILRYYLSNFYHVLAVSLGVSLFLLMLLGLRSKKTIAREQDEHESLRLAQHFMYTDLENQIEHIMSALNKRYKAERIDNFIKIDGIVIAINLSLPLSVFNLVSCYAYALKNSYTRLIVMCIDTDKNIGTALSHLDDIKVDVFKIDRIYNLLKSLNALPEIKRKPVKRKQKLKEFAINLFDRRRTKGYVLTSFVLIFGAYFSVTPIYFIVMAALSLTMAILSMINVSQKIKSFKSVR